MHPPQSPQIHSGMRVQPSTPSTDASSPAGVPPHSATPMSPPSRPNSTPKPVLQPGAGTPNRTPEQHDQVHNSAMSGKHFYLSCLLTYTGSPHQIAFK